MKITLLSLLCISTIHASSVPGAASSVPELENKSASNKRKPTENLEHEGAKKPRTSSEQSAGGAGAMGNVVMADASASASAPIMGKADKEEKKPGAANAMPVPMETDLSGRAPGAAPRYPFGKPEKEEKAYQASASASASAADVEMVDVAREQKQKAAAQGFSKHPWKDTKMEALVGAPTGLVPELLTVVADYLASNDFFVVVASEHLHKHAIRTIEELPDGCLALGSDSGLLRKWGPGMKLTDVIRFPIKRTNVKARIGSLQLLSNNRIAAGESGRQLIVLWDTQSTKNAKPLNMIPVFHGSCEAPLMQVLGSDRLVVAGMDMYTVWDARSNSPAVLETHPYPIVMGRVDRLTAFCCLRAGRLVSGSSYGLIRANLADKDFSAQAHMNAVTSLQESRDGRLISGSMDGDIKIWDLSAADPNKSVVTIPRMDAKIIVAMQVLQNGQLAVLAKNFSFEPVGAGLEQDRTIIVWDTGDRNNPPQQLAVLKNQSAGALRALRNGILAVGGLQGKIQIWGNMKHALMAEANKKLEAVPHQ